MLESAALGIATADRRRIGCRIGVAMTLGTPCPIRRWLYFAAYPKSERPRVHYVINGSRIQAPAAVGELLHSIAPVRVLLTDTLESAVLPVP